MEAHFDLDFVNTNLAIILMLKLSTLSHALLPSTLISVSDLDARVPLRLTFQPTLDYPFAGPIDFSIVGGLPEVKFKVLPVSESSGLKGVDLNSMPLLSTWIKKGLDSVLEEFVDPGFVRFDLDRYIKWSAWVSCGGGRSSGPTTNVPVASGIGGPGKSSKSRRKSKKAEIGKMNMQPLESIATVEVETVVGGSEGGGGGGGGEEEDKSLVVVSSDSSITSVDGDGGDGSQNLGDNIVLGNGGLEEVRKKFCEERSEVTFLGIRTNSSSLVAYSSRGSLRRS